MRPAPALAVATLVFIAHAGMSPAPDPDPRNPPGDRPATEAATIQIRLTAAGVQVTPSRVTVGRDVEVVWSSELPFAVAVERNAALFGRTLPPAALRGNGNAPVRVRTGPAAPAGTYKYAVAVWDGQNVWVVDPEIIISPN